MLAPGSRLGSYAIDGLLGKGGMGEVYRARDTRLDRDVALKVIAGLSDENARERLRQEARAAAALNHPHICTIHEITASDDTLFIVMEHIEGRPLSELVTTVLPPQTALQYAIQIAEGLSHAHARGIVHRDLKSANLMVTPDGRLKILDFGLARQLPEAGLGSETALPTMTTVMAGTPAYMAPEVLQGASIDRRSDIWALGVVLYEMVTGRRPFAGNTSFQLTSAILRDDPQPLPPDVSPSLGAVIAKCLSKHPAARYQHAGEVRAALDTIATARCEAFAPAATERAAYAPSRRPAEGATEKSILVLPFTNLSPSPDDAYFGEGLTDELITDLSRLPNVRVAPSAASFRLKNTDKDLATIGGELDVRYIVEGRVRKAGSTVRITAQLVDVAESRTIWADKYAGELDRAFELQERVSQAIADALQLRLRPPSRATSPAAAEAYLRGRHFARQATTAGFQKALECFQQATELDPNYAPPFAALAETYVNLTTGWDTLPAVATMPKAHAAVQRALELEPTLPEASMVRGLVAMYEWDLQTAERSFTEALRLHPGSADAHKWYAALLIWLDTRYEEALHHIRMAARLDPVDPWIQVQILWVHYFSRDYERAIEQGRQVISLDPLYGFGHYALGCALLTAGRADEAMTSLLRAAELDGRNSHYTALLGAAYAISGVRDKALECLSELEALERAGRNVAFWKLHVYAGLGDADQVIRCVEVAVEQRSSSAVFMVTHPYVDFVRRDPRFSALLRTMGLDHLTLRTWKNEWRPPTPAPAPVVVGRPRIASVAVLPLDNLSADPEQEYFADGITEAVIGAIAQLEGLRVISRMSAMRYKGTSKSIREVARDLTVDAVITGSVRRVGSRVRISVQLIDAATDSHAWSAQYDRDLEDILALESEIGRAVAHGIALKGTARAERPVVTRKIDPEAYALYLQGRHLARQISEPALREAIACFERVTEREPQYAAAYAALADAYHWLTFFEGAAPQATYEPGRRAARRAVELDPGLADAHVAVGSVAFNFEWDWAAAERAFRRAIELNPNSSVARLDYALFLGNLGRMDDAIGQAEAARDADPLWSNPHQALGYWSFLLGRDGESLAHHEAALRLDPDAPHTHGTSGFLKLKLGQHDEALAHFRRAVETSGATSFFSACLAYGYATVGRRAEAEVMMRELEERGRTRYISRASLCWPYIALGNIADALRCLKMAYEQHDSMLVCLPSFTWWDPIRDTDVFRTIVTKMNFPPAPAPR